MIILFAWTSADCSYFKLIAAETMEMEDTENEARLERLEEFERRKKVCECLLTLFESNLCSTFHTKFKFA